MKSSLFKVFAAIFIVTFCYQSLTPATARSEKQAFMTLLPSVPLMDGLVEDSDSSLLFDKPDGQIVEVALFSTMQNFTNVMAFYTSTLPQLGWHTGDENQFYKKDEILVFVNQAPESQSESGTTLKAILLPR